MTPLFALSSLSLSRSLCRSLSLSLSQASRLEPWTPSALTRANRPPPTAIALLRWPLPPRRRLRPPGTPTPDGRGRAHGAPCASPPPRAPRAPRTTSSPTRSTTRRGALPTTGARRQVAYPRPCRPRAGDAERVADGTTRASRDARPEDAANTALLAGRHRRDESRQPNAGSRQKATSANDLRVRARRRDDGDAVSARGATIAHPRSANGVSAPRTPARASATTGHHSHGNEGLSPRRPSPKQ